MTGLRGSQSEQFDQNSSLSERFTIKEIEIILNAHYKNCDIIAGIDPVWAKRSGPIYTAFHRMAIWHTNLHFDSPPEHVIEKFIDLHKSMCSRCSHMLSERKLETKLDENNLWEEMTLRGLQLYQPWLVLKRKSANAVYRFENYDTVFLFSRAEMFQKDVWGDDDLEVVPLSSFYSAFDFKKMTFTYNYVPGGKGSRFYAVKFREEPEQHLFSEAIYELIRHKNKKLPKEALSKHVIDRLNKGKFHTFLVDVHSRCNSLIQRNFPSPF
jgi:hypothetical protein